MNHNINDILIRLLTPNDMLDTSIFDVHQKMYHDVRNILLNQANHVFDKCFNYIPGLKLQDIYLTGSRADYFYQDESDIDVCLNIINENCHYLSQNEKTFNLFLTTVKFGTFNNQRFQAGHRSIDVSFGMPNLEFMGLYSIMQDKWIIEPCKEARAGLDTEDILTEYTRQFYQVKNYLREMRESCRLRTTEGLEELEKYYANSVKTSNVSLREYIIYKLLNYRGIHEEIKELFNQALKEYLSLK